MAGSSWLVATHDGLWRVGAGDDDAWIEPWAVDDVLIDGARPPLPAAPGLDALDDDVRIGPVVPRPLRPGVGGWVVPGDAVPLSRDELELLSQAASVRTLAEARRREQGAVAASLVARGLWELDPPEADASRPVLERSPVPVADPPPPPPPDDPRVRVHPVCCSPIAGLPLGLGDVVAAALAHDGGALAERYAVRPIRNEPDAVLAEVAADPRPVILLLSNFLWSVDANLELVRRVRALAPGSIAIHGGPSTPKYDGDVAAFFAADHAPDVAVLGEGEAALPEVLERLDGTTDVARAVGTPGTIVRGADGRPVRGPERERIPDLGVLPSPYLTGLFDHLDGGQLGLMAVETNRGCPFGCTFCDWGSATMSRIRKQPMARVLAELDWIARRDVGTLFIADANFGVMARDVDIARHVAHLKATVGAPRAVLSSFAKNTVKHSTEIVRTWVEAGIATEGSVALQTTDPTTLENIARTNIRIDKYDALAVEFRRLDLPVATDLMLGLPGATVDSFKADLQRCIDQDVTARIYPTVVLPNAPMNDPAYRERFALVLDDANVVVATSSFDDAAYREMLRVRRAFRAGEHFGVLRHVVRYVAHRTAIREIDQLDAMSAAGRDDPERWPVLRWLTHHLARWTVPPGPWPEALAEVRRFVVDELGAPDEPGLDVVLAVQAALLPSADRSLPDEVPLAHDYVRWYHEVLRPAEGTAALDVALTDLPPGTLPVADPAGVCGRNRALHLRRHAHPEVDSVLWNDFWIVDDWELASPLARPLLSSTRDAEAASA